RGRRGEEEPVGRGRTTSVPPADGAARPPGSLCGEVRRGPSGGRGRSPSGLSLPPWYEQVPAPHRAAGDEAGDAGRRGRARRGEGPDGEGDRVTAEQARRASGAVPRRAMRLLPLPRGEGVGTTTQTTRSLAPLPRAPPPPSDEGEEPRATRRQSESKGRAAQSAGGKRTPD
ncbi:hypothetical protein THAOC_01044, partial [Thalassiosira oceanica]